MFDENDIYNNQPNIEPNPYPEDDDEDKKVSRFQPQRRLKEQKLKRKIKKANKNIRLLRAIARLCLIAFLVALCYYTIHLKYWKLNPKAFSSLGNTSIKIENNYIASSDRILRAVQETPVDPGKPIFLMDTESIKESILKIPPIEKVYIKRFWCPARIEILVQEREPAITLAPNEKVPPIAFYTKDGKLIGRAYLPLNPMFKTVKVLTYGNYAGDEKMDADKIKFITTIARDIEQASKEPVQYIDWRNPDDIYVQIPTVKLKLGSISQLTYPNTLKKINGLPAILPQIKALNKKVKYLDLRWEHNLYYIKLADSEG